MAAPPFDPDIFYRITNVAIGKSVSLDAANPSEGVPTGEIDINPSGPFTGQAWQVLSTTSIPAGTFLLSTKFLGARMKLDIAVNDFAVYVPFLKNLTTAQDQTWIISQLGNSSSNSTYSLFPHMLGGSIALTVNTTTKQPFLDTAGGANQQWALTPLAAINDASFSASALTAVTTSASLPLTSTSSSSISSITSSTSAATTVSASPSSVQATESSSSNALHSGAALAAEVATPIILVFVILILISIVLVSRRKAISAKQQSILDRKIGYPLMQESRSQINLDFGRASAPPSPYAASTISSPASAQSSYMAIPFPSPLSPRPISWSRGGRNLGPFFRSLSLGAHGEVQDGTTRLVELHVPSPSPSPGPHDILKSLEPSLHEVEDEPAVTTPAQSQSFRPVSLISRWRL